VGEGACGGRRGSITAPLAAPGPRGAGEKSAYDSHIVIKPDTATSLPAAAGAGARRMAACIAAAVLAALVCRVAPPLQSLEERSRDALTALAASRAPVPGVLVVDISEESLKRVGTWPWSRAQLADLVEQLLGPLGARGVALDMVLPEQADPQGDARLASLARHAPLALAQVLDFNARTAPITIGTPAGGRSAAPTVDQPARATGFVANHAGLQEARCVGHIGVQPDADGVLRRIHLEAAAAGRAYPTLSLALLACVDPALATRALQGLGPQGGNGWRVPFRRDAEAFLTIPAEAVLQEQVDPAMVRGRFVLIGSSAVGLSDYVATPLQPVTAGVLVHAQMLAELLEAGNASRAAPSALTRLGWNLLGLAIGLAVVALALRRSVRIGLAALLAVCCAWLAVCALAFGAGAPLAVLPPVAGFLVYGASWLAMDFRDTRRVSRRTMATLSHYVAEPVLKLLVKQGLERTLEPSRQEITVLVADMAGYTRLTAQSSLEDSARLTTEFLEAITGPVLASGATLDRYTGDGLIAFWGAPLARPDHAASAFDAARQMLEAVDALNARRRSRGEHPLAMRIGIESGEALVGDLGSSVRSVYTAVGTCINLASRLQEIARDIGETLVVGPQARNHIGAALRSLGERSVRGIATPIELFGLPSSSTT